MGWEDYADIPDFFYTVSSLLDRKCLTTKDLAGVVILEIIQQIDNPETFKTKPQLSRLNRYLRYMKPAKKQELTNLIDSIIEDYKEQQVEIENYEGLDSQEEPEPDTSPGE